MKTIPCTALSGDNCAKTFEARTLEEMMEKFWDHMMRAGVHSELAKDLKRMHHSQHKHWQDKMMAKWHAAKEG
jgi:predicted small metal-binding protein